MNESSHKAGQPRVVIVGAGSLFFGRQAIWAMNHMPGLRGGTLVLVDTDPANLERSVKLAEMVAADAGSNTSIEGHSDFRKALPGADFVVMSFSHRNAHFRRIDCQVSEKYGIRMCSGDTIGPGGVFRTMREFPRILEIAHAAESLCPDAWVINYINPSAIMGIGLARHAKVKSFALCDIHHMPKFKIAYLKMLGLDEADLPRLDMRIAGVNHFNWMLKAELDGKNIMPDLIEAHRTLGRDEKDEGYAKRRFNNRISAELADVFGILPTCTSHTKEYVPYYQGRGPIQEPVPPLAVFDCDDREAQTVAAWQLVDDFINGVKPIADFHTRFGSDHATEIINNMVEGGDKSFFVSRLNSDCIDGGGKAVGNLPADALLELECVFGPDGPRPLPVGEFPLGVRALQMQILDIHELTIDAIIHRDRNLLVRALAMDPLVNSIATARQVIDELFDAQSEVLAGW
jgi:alpha-galactosidase/6-phospho-beta-glucosidase family protein